MQLPAVVSDPNGAESLSCVIRDGSLSGCQVIGVGVERLPDAVRVGVDGCGDPFEGNIVWRKPNRIGIKFRWAAKCTSGDERRGAPRRPVMIPVKLSDEQQCQSFNGTIRDGSGTGCRIECDDPAKIPDDVWLEIEGVTDRMKGRVVWRDETMAGFQLIWDDCRYEVD